MNTLQPFLYLSFYLSLFAATIVAKGQQGNRFYTFNDPTNLRQAAALQANRVDMLIGGEMVYDLGQRSENKTTISVNAIATEGYWRKVRTQSGQEGWVHEALLCHQLPQCQYSTWVANLRLRQAPNTQAPVLETLNEGVAVVFSGERSLNKERISLRGQVGDYYWLKIISPSGQEGWVYGGGLRCGGCMAKETLLSSSSTTTGVNNSTQGTISSSSSSVENNSPDAQALRQWWEGLNPEWRNFFNERILYKTVQDLYKTPTIEELKKIKSLRGLDLSNNDDCNTGPFYTLALKDLSGVEQLYDLEQLNCDYTRFDDLLPLSQLPKLQSLSIRNSKYNSLSGLERLKKLRWLDIKSEQWNNSDFLLLNPLQQLEELHIEVESISDFNALRSMFRLNKLIVKCPKIKSLSGIDALFNLRHLTIVSEQSTLDLRALERLQKMDYCALYGFEVRFPEVLGQCQALNYLVFSMVENNFDINTISNLVHLRELEIRCNGLLNPSGLRQLKSLRALYLGYIEQFDFEYISAEQIHSIEIEAGTLQNLQKLTVLKSLRRLALLCPNIASVKELPALVSLSYLRLKSDNITALEGIERFTRLYSIDITGCRQLRQWQSLGLLPELLEIYLPPHIPLNDPKLQELKKRPGTDIGYRPSGGCI